MLKDLSDSNGAEYGENQILHYKSPSFFSLNR